MFSQIRDVNYSEVSTGGYADCAQIADYFQDCSTKQSDALGTGVAYLREQHRAWLLASWQIVIHRYPELGEQVMAYTWPHAFDAIFGHRNFKLEDGDGKIIAVANSFWFMLDTETGRPIRLTEEIKAPYKVEEAAEMIYASRRVVCREDLEKREPFDIKRAYIDTNGHMNNAWYIRLGLEYIPRDKVVRQVRAEYKMAVKMGDIVFPGVYIGEDVAKVVLSNKEGQLYAILEYTF